MNKTISKILASIAAVAITISSSAITSFAVGPDGSPNGSTAQITFPAGSHQYEYYQIFTGDWYKDEKGKMWLTNASYGRNLDVDSLWQTVKFGWEDEVKDYCVKKAISNGDYPLNMDTSEVTYDILQEYIGAGNGGKSYNINNLSSCDDMLSFFAYLQETYPERLNDPIIQGGVGSYSDGDSGTSTTLGEYWILRYVESFLKGQGIKVNTKESESVTISVPNGYYLIQEHVPDSDESKATIAKIVDGKINIKPKFGGTPSIEKKIAENVKTIQSAGTDLIGGYKDLKDMSNWNDAADYSIGDEVPFAIFGSLPEYLDYFDDYYYCIVDRLAAGFDAPVDFDIEIGEVIDDKFYGQSIRSMFDYGTRYNYNVSLNSDGSRTIEFEMLNIKDLQETYNTAIQNHKLFPEGMHKFGKDTVIMVSYKAKLNDKAVIGCKGNTNGVYLVYTDARDYDSFGFEDGTLYRRDDHNVYKEGSALRLTQDTKWDGVTAFTYEVDINKIDSATLESLPGAVFSVQAMDGTHKDKYVIVDENGKVSGWSDTVTDDNHLISDENGKVTVSGLDDGKYELVEIKAPNNYHNLKAPVTMTLNATLDDESKYLYRADDGSAAFKEFKEGEEELADVDVENGIYSMNITNSMGVSLPETGGSGVYLLYAVGGLLLVGGSTYLMTRKKKKK